MAKKSLYGWQTTNTFNEDDTFIDSEDENEMDFLSFRF